MGVTRAAGLALAALALAPTVALGAQASALATVPTVAELRGFETGEGFSAWADVARVVDGIDAASDRVRVERYGRSVEERDLLLAWVSAPANLARLDSLRAAQRRFLDDPEAASLGPDHPVFVWLSFGVHGDEAATTEAALELLRHLAAAGDPATARLLEEAVVAIDPLLNPDGHERYVTWYRSVAGPAPNPDPAAREHRPPWPGGRTNHWYFDLNRDWAWGVMPETRARRAAYLATLPQVHVDVHEMDAASSYFFFPPAPPVHALYPESTHRWGDVFGAANAAAFDARRWPYYTAEDFDLFYPGYGDSWPSFYGATGMTYEQAGGGAAGLALARPDGSVLTLRERVEHHLVAALTTIETAVARRAERLADFAAFWRRPTRLADGVPAAYVVPRAGHAADALAALLADQAVRVDTLAAPLAAAGLAPYPGVGPPPDTLPPGTFLITGDQPLGRYLAALMAPETALPDTSLFYDITGWTLPFLYDVPAWHAAALPAAETGRWRPVEPPAPEAVTEGGWVALAWPYEALPDAAAAARLLARGVRVRVADRPFATGGRLFPRGSFVVLAADQPDALPPGALARAVAAEGVDAAPLASARSDDGVDLGSVRLRSLDPPRVAVAAGPAVDPPSLGATWHLLEKAGVPVDVVRLVDLAAPPGADPDSLAGRDAEPLRLDPYTAIVLPDGPDAAAYAAAVGEAGAARLGRWVEGGGTLVGLRSAAAWLAGEAALADVDLAEPPEPTPAERRAPAQAREEAETWERIPGTLVAVEVDATHPLGYGYTDGRAAALVRDPVEFALAEAGNPWVYADADPLAGYLPPAARARLPGTPYALAVERGDGHVVLVADDPAFRGIVPGLGRLVLNAILLAGR